MAIVKVKTDITNMAVNMIGRLVGWFLVINATFNNMSVISWRAVFIGRGNWSTRRNKPTCRKSHTNFIT